MAVDCRLLALIETPEGPVKMCESRIVVST